MIFTWYEITTPTVDPQDYELSAKPPQNPACYRCTKVSTGILSNGPFISPLCNPCAKDMIIAQGRVLNKLEELHRNINRENRK